MRRMQLFTKDQEALLLKNGMDRSEDRDYPPVVKLFTPDAQATWLISEIDPANPDIAFGLCDLGVGHPELGYVSIAELESIRGCFGLPVERDQWFEGEYPVSVYAEAAITHGRITTSDTALEKAAGKLGKDIAMTVGKGEEMER